MVSLLIHMVSLKNGRTLPNLFVPEKSDKIMSQTSMLVAYPEREATGLFILKVIEQHL